MILCVFIIFNLNNHKKVHEHKQEQKELKNIIEKHRDVVQYFKDNYKTYFGFRKDYQVKRLIITRIKENFENEDCKIQILPEYELKSIVKGK